jgi:hypothetical protein
VRIINGIALVAGLGVFAIFIVLGILAVNNSSILYIALFGIADAMLASIGFELCRFAFCLETREYRFFSRGHRGYIFDMMIMLLAICLMVATVNYQHDSGLLCNGRLSAGFPFAFICDASGESPLSSVGTIGWADLDNLSFIGSFLDILFYLTLVWIARLAVHRLSEVVGRRTRLR